MAHYTKQQLEEAVRSFEPNIFARDDQEWKPAQDRIRQKMAAAPSQPSHAPIGPNRTPTSRAAWRAIRRWVSDA